MDLLVAWQRKLHIPGDPFCWIKPKACPNQTAALTSRALPAPSAVQMGG